MTVREQFEKEIEKYEKATVQSLQYYKKSFAASGYSMSIGLNEQGAAKVYRPELALDLSTKKPTYNFHADKIIFVNGREFMSKFEMAYNSGKQYFETMFPNPEVMLCGSSADKFVKKLKTKYFDIPVGVIHRGWIFVKNSWSDLNDESVEQFGFYSGVVNSVDELISNNPDSFVGFYDGQEAKKVNKPEEAGEPAPDNKSKPVFSDQIQGSLFDILKDYFPVDQQDDLADLLKNGKSNHKQLNFTGKGMQLADVFKKLHSEKLIVIPSKKDLQRWIRENFVYRDTYGSFQPFKLATLEAYFSPTQHCKDPILDIERENDGDLVTRPNNRMGFR